MRKIDLIVIHCTDTPATADPSVDEIRRWHIQERGFDDIGYHYLIRRNGKMEIGRREDVAGAHAGGNNARSIGIALNGGKGASGKPDNNFTPAQMTALNNLLNELYAKYGKIKTVGHNEISTKFCPCFDVQSWIKATYG